jgi:hypothetical protein
VASARVVLTVDLGGADRLVEVRRCAVLRRGGRLTELRLRCRSVRLLPRRGAVVWARSSVWPWAPSQVSSTGRWMAPVGAGWPRSRGRRAHRGAVLPGGRVRLRCRPYAPCGSGVTSITDGRYVGWSGADEVPKTRSSTSFGKTVTVAALRGRWYVPTGHRG